MKETNQRQVSRGLMWIQAVIGFSVYVGMTLPYLRRTHGLARLQSGQRYLFACNHISLLDSILMGGWCWRTGRYPILVLADKNVWHASRLRRWISRHTSFPLERGKLDKDRIHDLQAFGRAGKDFQLIVFPEGTRGDGVKVAPCQPGIFFIAQAARIPIVPVFIENMQLISTKTGRFHLWRGWRKVEVHFGEPIVPATFLALPRKEFVAFVRERITAARTQSPAP